MVLPHPQLIFSQRSRHTQLSWTEHDDLWIWETCLSPTQRGAPRQHLWSPVGASLLSDLSTRETNGAAALYNGECRASFRQPGKSNHILQHFQSMQANRVKTLAGFELCVQHFVSVRNTHNFDAVAPGPINNEPCAPFLETSYVCRCTLPMKKEKQRRRAWDGSTEVGTLRFRTVLGGVRFQYRETVQFTSSRPRSRNSQTQSKNCAHVSEHSAIKCVGPTKIIEPTLHVHPNCLLGRTIMCITFHCKPNGTSCTGATCVFWKDPLYFLSCMKLFSSCPAHIQNSPVQTLPHGFKMPETTLQAHPPELILLKCTPRRDIPLHEGAFYPETT